MPTTQTTIAEIREARAKVKSAPWFNNVCVTIDSIHGQLGRSVAYLDEQDYDEDEANFIARAPEYVDFLLAELEGLNKHVCQHWDEPPSGTPIEMLDKMGRALASLTSRDIDAKGKEVWRWFWQLDKRLRVGDENRDTRASVAVVEGDVISREAATRAICKHCQAEVKLEYFDTGKTWTHVWPDRQWQICYASALYTLPAIQSAPTSHPFGKCGYKYCDWPDGELRCNEMRIAAIQSAPTESARKAAEEIANELFRIANGHGRHMPFQRTTIVGAVEPIITRHIGKVENEDAK